MLNDNPERLDRNQRLAKQFQETTPAGRLFLLAFYAVAGVLLLLFLGWFNDYMAPFDKAFGQWVASFFN